jgi:hypothetical protein
VDPEPGNKKSTGLWHTRSRKANKILKKIEKGINFKSWMFSLKAGGLWKSFMEA